MPCLFSTLDAARRLGLAPINRDCRVFLLAAQVVWQAALERTWRDGCAITLWRHLLVLPLDATVGEVLDDSCCDLYLMHARSSGSLSRDWFE